MIENAIPFIPGAWPLFYASIEWFDHPETYKNSPLPTRIEKHVEHTEMRKGAALISVLGALAQAIIAIASKSFPVISQFFLIGAALNNFTCIVSSCLIFTASQEINKLKEVLGPQRPFEPHSFAYPENLNRMD